MKTLRPILIALWRGVAALLACVFDARTDAAIAPEKLRRILWVRLDHIGDVAMSLPALAALRSRYPDAQIDALVRPACAPLLSTLSLADRVLSYDSPRFPQRKNTRGAGLWRTLIFAHRLRRRNYDLAIDARGDDIARLLVWLARIPIRLGFDRAFYEAPDAPNLKFLLTHAEPFPQAPDHAVRNNLKLLRVLDVPQDEAAIAPQNHPLRELLSEDYGARVEAKLQEIGAPQKFVVLHLFANDAARNWDIDRWAQVANALLESRDVTIVLSGAAQDQAANEEFMATVRNSGKVINAAGVFTLEELPAFFSRAQLLLTVDTGPMHLAAAAGTPIVALFLSHLAPRHAPWGQSRAVICGDEESLHSISVHQVLDRAQTVLNV